MFQFGPNREGSGVPLVDLRYRAMIPSQLSSTVVTVIVRGLEHAML